MLIGRSSECATLDQLLAAVRRGESRALIVRGDPGVGKSALLEYVAERSAGCRLARATAVQSEMELAFAGLHQLCTQMLDRLDRLPAPQRDALATAFGLHAGPTPDRFLIGLATLTLLSEVADERPLVCVVDDAQWLDRASAQALAFAARRLFAESVALVFAARGPAGEQELTGLPELVVHGLPDPDARALLASVMPGPLDARIRDRIIAETQGNPLALLELPRGLTPAQLAGGFVMPGASTVPGWIEDGFRRRLEGLPEDTRRLLLVAAAEPLGEPLLLWRAAERLGIGTGAATPATALALLELAPRVRFRHPLVRSAVYCGGSLHDRQSVHRALADVTDPEIDPDRRAWHRAHAAPGPDEEVAEELERSAGRAQARGGMAAAAAFLERAAGLTLEPARRGERALAAAQATHLAGAPNAALELLATAEAGPLGEFQRARVSLLRAQIAYAQCRGSDAPPLLLHAAKRLEPLDAALARDTYLEAISAAQFAGRLATGGGVLEAAEAARAAPLPEQPPRASDLLLDGLAVLISEGYATGAPIVKRALCAFRDDDLSSEQALRWLWLACRTAIDVWDCETWEVLSRRLVSLARGTGALAALPIAVGLRMGLNLRTGDLAAAAALSEEQAALTAATGSQLGHYGVLLLVAWRGREAEAAGVFEASTKEVASRGEGIGLTVAQWASAVLHNGLGRYGEALSAAQAGSERPEDLNFANASLVELVEAAARTGKTDAATEALHRLSQTTRPSATDWALGMESRCRALVTEGRAAERLYRHAIERLGRTRMRVELARAHLLYGEWLRRENRRLDAREQLRKAHGMLAAMGIDAFAERAARELLATGETARKRTIETSSQLTAQETEIARLAREGLSNPEIGARLFISPRTVQYHLSKVFTKLDINSRTQLDRALPGAPTAA